jgi:hypothetical protein
MSDLLAGRKYRLVKISPKPSGFSSKQYARMKLSFTIKGNVGVNTPVNSGGGGSYALEDHNTLLRFSGRFHWTEIFRSDEERCAAERWMMKLVDAEDAVYTVEIDDSEGTLSIQHPIKPGAYCVFEMRQ